MARVEAVVIQVFSNSLDVLEAQKMMAVMYSRWLGRGKECEAFEREWAAHIGQKRCLLFNCCTSAAFVALRAIGVDAGDEVIIPTAHFVGVANAVVELHARPVCADVDPHTMNILPEEIDRLRTHVDGKHHPKLFALEEMQKLLQKLAPEADYEFNFGPSAIINRDERELFVVDTPSETFAFSAELDQCSHLLKVDGSRL